MRICCNTCAPTIPPLLRYTIYRWSLQDKRYSWFISLTPIEEEHGLRDTDFFRAASTYELGRPHTDDLFPPAQSWKEMDNVSGDQVSDIRITWELTEELVPDDLFVLDSNTSFDDSFCSLGIDNPLDQSYSSTSPDYMASESKDYDMGESL